ncbi:MAG: ADP-ribosylglycohydrolase family protein [Chloroflexi bacterium]|nr:ADP-ribosylglycohydrolase family protein [Chloroflexota bacterium]
MVTVQVTEQLSDQLTQHAHACLVAGLIGDAMGTPTEGKLPEQIEEQFGWVEEFSGTGTDDSIMKDVLCDALIETDGYATSDDWATHLMRRRADIFGEKRNRFFVSVMQMMRKLGSGYLPREASLGNLPSSSSAMAIAPVGIVNACNPRGAAQQAQELASLIHTNDVGFCQDGAVAVAAAVAAALTPGASIDDVLEAAVTYIKPVSGAAFRTLIEDALALARSTGDYKTFRAAYHARFQQYIACDSRETIPATLALCLLANGDPTQVIIYGANFGRDTDTIATMAGAICGALKGPSALRASWIEIAEATATRNQTGLARRLIEVAQVKAGREAAAWSALGSVVAIR